jgi:protein SCO1/2
MADPVADDQGSSTPGQRQRSWARIGTALLLTGVAGWLFWSFESASRVPRVVATDGLSRLEPPLELPVFELTAGDGSPVSRASLRGHWTLLSLGFTSCPDVCPRTLSTLVGALDLAEPPSVSAQVFFVSVDPERDSLARLGAYAGGFGSAVLAATGPHAELERLTRPLGLFYEKEQAAGPASAYGVAHSTAVLVIAPDARVVGLIGSGMLAPAEVAAALERVWSAG